LPEKFACKGLTLGLDLQRVLYDANVFKPMIYPIPNRDGEFYKTLYNKYKEKHFVVLLNYIDGNNVNVWQNRSDEQKMLELVYELHDCTKKIK